MPVDIAAELPLLPKELDYNIHVKPILSDKCFACHGPDKAKQKAGLRLDFAENAYAELPESPAKWPLNPRIYLKANCFTGLFPMIPNTRCPPRNRI